MSLWLSKIEKLQLFLKKIPMNFGVILVSLVLPFQVSIFSAEKERASPFWGVQVAIILPGYLA